MFPKLLVLLALSTSFVVVSAGKITFFYFSQYFKKIIKNKVFTCGFGLINWVSRLDMTNFFVICCKNLFFSFLMTLSQKIVHVLKYLSVRVNFKQNINLSNQGVFNTITFRISGLLVHKRLVFRFG